MHQITAENLTSMRGMLILSNIIVFKELFKNSTIISKSILDSFIYEMENIIFFYLTEYFMNIDLLTKNCSRETIESWLRATDQESLFKLYALADSTRRAHVGDDVFLRGLIEWSNICRRSCLYCGLRSENKKINRYRMSAGELVECAKRALGYGYKTIVLQAGEDPELTGDVVADAIHQIRNATGQAITLSLGERTREELALWREAGADRYLIRFETSNKKLYEHIHPSLPCGRDRFSVLDDLRELGYEVGTGVMVGIPGQRYEDLANDILLFRDYDFDMIGLGPWLPHPEAKLSSNQNLIDDQVPNDVSMTCKMLAITRILCPSINIPATTALATLDPKSGREQGLSCGANILMPNCTPLKYRGFYEIYTGKVCAVEDEYDCQSNMIQLVLSIGRTIGDGVGTSKNFERRMRDKI